MRLAETIAGWFGRVEVVLAGVEGYLRDGEEALARGDAMTARRAAKAMLQRVPHSPLGLALRALPLGVQAFQSQYSSDTAAILAFTSLAMLPALLFFTLAERQIVGGLQGAVKG